MYYIYDKSSIIYIRKTKNLKKSVTTCLTSKSSKAIKIQKQIDKISYDQTGSELLALLKEQQEIKENQPKLNFKYRLYSIGIRLKKNNNGYNTLNIEQIKTGEKYLFAFKNKITAINQLNIWIKDYNLCKNLTSISNTTITSVQDSFKKCKGHCCCKEDLNIYNKKLQEMIENLKFIPSTFIMIDKGRNVNEKSFVLIENQLIKGYGYYDLNYQIKSLKKIKNRMVKIDHNQDVKSIIYSYIKSNKYQEIIQL